MFGTDAGNDGPTDRSVADGADLLAAATAKAVETPVATDEQDEAPSGEKDSTDGSFDPGVWEPAEQRYGLVKLMGLREAMLPIEKPADVSSLKFLFFPGYGLVDDDEPPERERRSDRREGGDRRGGKDRKGGGKGRQAQQGGRFVPEMGKTELQTGYVKNQWHRNSAPGDLAVIVREGFSLMSAEIWKIPNGHYVQQAGPSEVFVSGQATGLTRMPVFPRGWVTADASTVGGPKYLEAVRLPRWKVAFKSDTPKGDILVREAVSLESEEVGCIVYGSTVLQSGPQETLEDGIIRMPITWHEAEPSSGSGAGAKTKNGWVTCDASSQGGPKFFTSAPNEESKTVAAEADRQGASGSRSAPAAAAKATDGFTSWDKNRMWRVANLEPTAGRSLPLVTRSEPYAPGTGRVPAEELVVRWLVNDEVVEQIGHSKKTRGYMVMPVKVVRDAEGNDVKDAEGWVTRRLVDKQRDGPEAWLVEVREGDEDEERERRRAARREGRGDTPQKG